MSELMDVVKAALDDAVGSPVEFSVDSHLLNDEILDSLDSAVFLLNIEKAAGVKLPEADVEEHDLYQISNLLTYLEKAKPA